MSERPTILFLSVASSARSPMAEGLARAKFGDRFRIASAGSRPATVNRFAIEAMAEARLDISSQRSKLVDDVVRELGDIDLVVTLCAEEEVCPAVLRPVRRLHWPILDPATSEPLSDREMLMRFRMARRTINARLAGIEAALAIPATTAIMPAAADDRAEIEALLRAANLPPDGLDDAFPRGFAIARLDGELVGAAGVEQWDIRGLLRSVVVAGAHRGKHIGDALVADRIAWATAFVREVDTVPFASMSLLTTTAAPFFERLGFHRIDRAELPAPLAASTQLQIQQCSSAVAMHRVFFHSTEEHIAKQIAAELAAHGTLVPPWHKFPEIPRYSIGWRMGYGEDYLWTWRTWWERQDATACQAYVETWKPTAPAEWSDWFDDDDVDEDEVAE